jgi:lysosomal acid lipase/cholesteryl ester hydrolase
LAVHPKLNDQVNVFIALAPAMSPAGLSNGVVDALVKASPQVLFLLFGRRSILSSATMWESLLYPPLFTKLIDLGLSFLFNWRTQNISASQKLAAYPHLYSFTSTKSVVHWFQIIRTKSFQMYDDDVHPPVLLTSSSKYTKVARYPTRNIRTPVVLVYGGSDSLVDIKAMLRELPAQTVANEIPHYEHLDFLWARDVDEQVFPHVFDALESFVGAEHTREEYARYQIKRQNSNLQQAMAMADGAKKLASLKSSDDVVDSDVSTAVGGVGESGSTHDEANDAEDEGERRSPPRHRATTRPRAGSKTSSLTEAPGERRGEIAEPQNSPSPSVSLSTGHAQGPAPEVLRFGDAAVVDTAGVPVVEKDAGAPVPTSPTRPKRRGTGSSQMSPDSMKGGKGIRLGAST